MDKNPTLLYKTLVIGIIFLFIGMNIVSSTDNFLKENPANCSPLKSVIGSEEKIFPNTARANTTWYMFSAYDPSSGEGFWAWYPNGTYRFSEWAGDDFFSGGTWTNDGRYLCCMCGNGTLYDIDLETFDACAIGDGGVSLNGLAYDPVSKLLFGASGKDLYEIDISTGEQTHIGAFGIDNASHMIAIAFDIYGICFGWDVKFSGESYLYRINTSTGEATIVGGMGTNLCYAQDGAFDFYTDTLYLVAYSSTGFLAKVDKETGELIFLVEFMGGTEFTALAISYFDNEKPVTTISFDPPEPDGENGWYVSDVNVTLSATDDMLGVDVTYYRINYGVWEIYTEPFTLSEDGDDILIQYYSVDNAGNVEYVKATNVDIDQTGPEIDLTYGFIGGNRWKGWDFLFNATADDLISGMDRVEFYVNDTLQESINGTGPYYECVIKLFPFDYDFNSFFVRGLICNLEITEEFVNFYSIFTFIRLKSWGDPPKIYAVAYDLAGNYKINEIMNPKISTDITPGIYLFQKLTLPNSYTGHVGRFFVSAIFETN